MENSVLQLPYSLQMQHHTPLPYLSRCQSLNQQLICLKVLEEDPEDHRVFLQGLVDEDLTQFLETQVFSVVDLEFAHMFKEVFS